MTTPTATPRSTTSASPTLARASSKTHRLQRDKRTPNGSNRPRPRRQPKPPPPTLKDKARAIREHAYFWPSVIGVLVVLGGLVWQAIRIASHADEFTPAPVPRAPKPKRATTSLSPSPLSSASAFASSAAASASSVARPLEDRLSEAVQGALSNAWNLNDVDTTTPEADTEGTPGAGAGRALRPPAGDVQDNTPGEGERMRTLQELYADMEALGMNIDDMTQVLHRAQREAPAGGGGGEGQ